MATISITPVSACRRWLHGCRTDERPTDRDPASASSKPNSIGRAIRQELPQDAVRHNFWPTSFVADDTDNLITSKGRAQRDAFDQAMTLIPAIQYRRLLDSIGLAFSGADECRSEDNAATNTESDPRGRHPLR
jgi:hypothetical protein